MTAKKKKLNNGELPESAISQKSRSRAAGAFKGFGGFPNKQKNVDFRNSGSPRFSHFGRFGPKMHRLQTLSGNFSWKLLLNQL